MEWRIRFFSIVFVSFYFCVLFHLIVEVGAKDAEKQQKFGASWSKPVRQVSLTYDAPKPIDALGTDTNDKTEDEPQKSAVPARNSWIVGLVDSESEEEEVVPDSEEEGIEAEEEEQEEEQSDNEFFAFEAEEVIINFVYKMYFKLFEKIKIKIKLINRWAKITCPAIQWITMNGAKLKVRSFKDKILHFVLFGIQI